MQCPEATLTKKRMSYRKKTKTKRLVDEVETPKLCLENKNIESSSDDEPAANQKAKSLKHKSKQTKKETSETAYETTFEESTKLPMASSKKGNANPVSSSSSESQNNTSTDSEPETSNEELVSDGNNGLRSRCSKKRKSPALVPY